MRISVVVPVYNRREMVMEALESVVRQTRKPDEILLVDDGSDDGSGKAASAFKGVTLIQQPNRGISAARNAGIKQASGDCIAFLDSDDLWEKDKLRLQERYMAGHPEIQLCHTDEVWVKQGRRINPKRYHRKEGGFLFVRSLERCLISPSAVMIRRSLFDLVGLFDERMPVCEDYDLWLRITARYPVGFIPAPLTIKRGGHSDQLSKKLPTMDRYRILSLEKVLRQAVLAKKERRETMRMVLKKAKIVLQGFQKRNNIEDEIETRQRIAALIRDYRSDAFQQRQLTAPSRPPS